MTIPHIPADLDPGTSTTTRTADGAGSAAPIGAVVLMMVDNTVEGDGRVQKAARAMADAGHRVVLLGKAVGRADEWPVGAALVRRVPVPFTLERAQRRRLERYRAVARRLNSALAGLREHLPTVSGRAIGEIGPSVSTGRVGRRVTGGTPVPGPGRVTSPLDDTVLDTVRAQAWKAILGNRCWARLEPRLLDYERAYWPVIAAMRPQILHAHDYRMLGVAVRAARRLRAQGHDVRVVFDSHEFLPGVGGPTRRWQIAYEAYEQAHIRQADAVVAVSPEMAERIQAHYGLPVRPSVVMNAPPARGSAEGSGDVRAVLNLAADSPLLVYLGMSAAKRGLMTAVQALPELPGVHLALLTRRNDYVEQLLAEATRLDVADRFHLLDYVPVEDVVGFIRTASAGVQSMVHIENYDVTIATKYFDYARARLPIIQSDVRAMAAMTRTLGNGEVFVAEDRDSFVRATQLVLADLPRYRAAYDTPGLLQDWTWERQADVLAQVYRRVLAAQIGTPVPAVPTVGR